MTRGVEVNVYSDASKRQGLSAWGCVVIRPGSPPFEASGTFASRKGCSTTGEIRAAGNAIHKAIRAGLIKVGDRVVVRCDNQAAVRVLNGEAFRKRKRLAETHSAWNEVVDWIVETATARGFEVSAAWVKGHQKASSPDPHARHNRRADQLCGQVTGTHKVRKSRARPPKSVRQAAKRRGIDKDALLALAVDGEIRSEGHWSDILL